MKSLLFAMERSGNIPPHTISSVVIERNNELKFGGKRNPDSEINRILESDKKKNEDTQLKTTVDELAKEIEKLKQEKNDKDKLLNDSQSAIQDLLAMVNALKNDNPQEKTTKKANKPKKEN
jgi:hypothetical protein